MRHHHLIISCLFAISLLTAACVNYNEIEPFNGKNLPRKCGYTTGFTNDWIYFNLRTGKIFNEKRVNSEIEEGEQKSRTDWDLGFCGYVMRTNSGTSGIGKGGAADLGEGNYEQWKTLSQLPADIQWVVDTPEVEITMSSKDWIHYLVVNKMDIESNPWFDPNFGPKKTKTDANPLLYQAIKFTAPPPTFTPSYHTYVVRTADGKRFFKLQIVSWYSPDMMIGDGGGRVSYYCEELK